MADIADEAQGAEEQLITQGLTSIRAQLASSGTEECRHCGVSIPERRRQLLPGVSTCVECQERSEFYQKVGSVRVADNDAD
ncbi:TraR/DksA C4-type zinc finger protein [Enterobacter sp. JMULE2]|uniref:TraR/DksA C4-type zinc finger protein n=1 Tax=Enterobacter sp. JMULE2 TaxID=2518340 RepID=UPI001576687F|nr:TraR/DksA C4-type zinc finger protein [Enterobacter sp. JMULE2]